MKYKIGLLNLFRSDISEDQFKESSFITLRSVDTDSDDLAFWACLECALSKQLLVEHWEGVVPDTHYLAPASGHFELSPAGVFKVRADLAYILDIPNIPVPGVRGTVFVTGPRINGYRSEVVSKIVDAYFFVGSEDEPYDVDRLIRIGEVSLKASKGVYNEVEINREALSNQDFDLGFISDTSEASYQIGPVDVLGRERDVIIYRPRQNEFIKLPGEQDQSVYLVKPKYAVFAGIPAEEQKYLPSFTVNSSELSIENEHYVKLTITENGLTVQLYDPYKKDTQ